MQQIWKYQLAVEDDQYIEMPKGAKPLSVGVQRSEPVIWVQVDPSGKSEDVHIRIFGTGQPMFPTNDMQFVGTFQIGGFVGHVFVQSH